MLLLPQDPASGYATSSAAKILQTDPVQLSELLSRLSQLQVKPHPQWLEGVLATLQPHLRSLSTAQLSTTLQVLGGWGFMPPEPFMQELHQAVRAQLGAPMPMRHIADLAWGLAQLQNARQPMLGELLQAAQDLMQAGHCSTSSIAAQHNQHEQHSQQQDQSAHGPGCSVDSQQQPHEQARSPACCPASLADLVWSVAKLQHNPGEAWLHTFASTSLPLLDSFTPHQLAQVVWAFARLPYQPSTAWMDGFLEVVRIKLQAFDSKSVSLTAWALATLKVQPTARWLFAFERQAERTLSTLAASELACTLWALSELKSKRADKLRLGRLVRRQEGEWVMPTPKKFGGGAAGGVGSVPGHVAVTVDSASALHCLMLAAAEKCVDSGVFWVHACTSTQVLMPYAAAACCCVAAAVFWGFDYEALANPRLLRVVRQLTLGPQSSRS